MAETAATIVSGARRIVGRILGAAAVEDGVDARPSGPIARIIGAQALAAGALGLFAPLAVTLLSAAGAPSWTYVVAIISAAPLIAASAIAVVRPSTPGLFAAALGPLAIGAAWFSWLSGGPFSPAAPWVFASIAGVALMGGRRGAMISGLLAIGFGALFLSLGDPPIRLRVASTLEERELTAVLSWSLALFGIAACAWAALTSWTQALPPLRRPTIAARRALSLLADDSAVTALRVSQAGVVIQALGAPDRAIDLPRDDLRGIDLKTLAHPDDLPQLLAMLDAARHPKDAPPTKKAGAAPTPEAPKIATVRIRSRSGAFEWVEVTAASAKSYPKPPRMGAASSDALLIFRERWRAGDAVASDGRSTDAAFLAQINSHLRSSIKSIHGYTEILTNEIFGPLGTDRYREYARLAHEDSSKLLSLVDELLDLAEIEAGRFVANSELIDPVPLIDGAVRNMTQTAERLGVALTSEFPPNAPYIRVDRRALRRALSGLALDGLRRADIGDQVALKIDVEDGAVRFSVVVTAGRAAQGAAPGAPKLAAPGLAAPGLASPGLASPGLAKPGMPAGMAPPINPEAAAQREAIRAAAQLSRVVARSLVERMSGAILIASDDEKAAEGRPLVASEAIFETPRSASAGSSAPRAVRAISGRFANPVGFAPEDEESQAAAERARAAAEADAERVNKPLFSHDDDDEEASDAEEKAKQKDGATAGGGS